MIDDFQDAVEHAVVALETTGIPRPKSAAEWVEYDIPQTGRLSTGGEYFIHGFGCAVKTPDLCVDFDFGEHGEIDGFDCYRVSNFAAKCLSIAYGIADEKELKRLFDEACDNGDLIDSGYILWYLQPELLRAPARNVDQQQRSTGDAEKCEN